MKHQALFETLKDLGLSENESRVYLAALSLGPSTIARIAQEAETKRTTVYPVIQSLERQGLMNVQVRGFKKLYVAEGPQRLEAVMERTKEKFQKSLPGLTALYNLKGSEATLKHYEGLEGVKSAYLSLFDGLKSHDYYYSISEVDRWYALDPEFFESIRLRRSKIPNLDIRIIANDTPGSREYKKKEKNYAQEVRLLPSGPSLHNSVTFTPHKIIFHQILAPYNAIVIENKSVIQTQKELFEVVWNSIQ